MNKSLGIKYKIEKTENKNYLIMFIKKQISFVVLLLLSARCISVSTSLEDVTCEPGYAIQPTDIRTSGSQCSGLSKITTWQECKLAAEYNRKNNIDKNLGFGGRLSSSSHPPGCIYWSGTNRYYLNDYTKSTYKCSNIYKCICKTKTCNKCPRHTYSEGGTNPTCTPCPKDTPYTYLNSKHDSIDSCTNVLQCEAGEGVTGIVGPTDTRVSGLASQCSGISKITTAEECAAAAEYNSKNNIDKNEGFGGPGSDSWRPPGCIYYSDEYWWNDNTQSTKQCSNEYKCICKTKACSKCPINKFSKGGTNPTCTTCHNGQVTIGKGQSKCVGQFNKEYVMWKLNNIDQVIAEQKEKENDLSLKNSRLWAKHEQRELYEKIMKERKSRDNENEEKSCESELNRKYGTVVFPAVEVANEIEINQDTTCVDTNRDELLKSFCGFRKKLEHLFNNENETKPAKSFWPNICCKERNDKDNPKTLETCEPPANSNIKRENIIPFALSQGGNYNRHNLYVEVADTIKHHGYLHNGMIDLINHIIKDKKRHHHIHEKINKFFKGTSLCGPRILQAPGKSDRMLCELFVPYHHLLDTMYNFVEKLYVKKYIKSQEASSTESFLQTMERSFSKRQNRRLGKNAVMGDSISLKGIKDKIKDNTNEVKAFVKSMEPTCDVGIKYDIPEKLRNKKKELCPYKHIDLSDGVATTSVQNIAIHYLRNDFKEEDYTDQNMVMLHSRLRYEVIDIDGFKCPAPLFYADDISIQQVSMNAEDTKEEWVAVIKLNTHAKNGYFQSELKQCFAKPYIPIAKVKINVFVDKKDCCNGNKDYTRCISTEDTNCKDEVKTFKSKYGDKDYGKIVTVDGAHFEIKGSHIDRRRRLFQVGNGGES